jgi:hypothetical protein
VFTCCCCCWSHSLCYHHYHQHQHERYQRITTPPSFCQSHQRTNRSRHIDTVSRWSSSPIHRHALPRKASYTTATMLDAYVRAAAPTATGIGVVSLHVYESIGISVRRHTVHRSAMANAMPRGPWCSWCRGLCVQSSCQLATTIIGQSSNLACKSVRIRNCERARESERALGRLIDIAVL